MTSLFGETREKTKVLVDINEVLMVVSLKTVRYDH